MTEQHNEHVLTFYYWELIRLGRRETIAKRWAKFRGNCYGARGGWIYCSYTHRPLCQGWLTVFYKHREAILTAIADGVLIIKR